MQTEKILVQAPEGIPQRMVTEYVNRCLAGLPKAVEALNRSDYGQLRIFGHRLRGSGGAYGIPALTEIGLAMETAASQDDASQLWRQVAALQACLEQIDILPDGGPPDAVRDQP